MSGRPGPERPVIDAHTHIFPPGLVADRSSHLGRDIWFTNLYRSAKATLATVEELIASMDAAGVTRSVVCGFPWSDPGLCRDHNAYMAESAARFPDRISWLGIVAPGSDSVERDARSCLENGARGFGEINADAQGADLRDARAFRAIVAIAAEAGLPLMIHTSEPVGHDYPGKGTSTPDRVLAFLSAFPETSVVAAHWGGGLPFYELMPEVAALTRRLTYDTGASTYLYRFQIYRAVLGIVGQDRVLFGSDYPVLKQTRFLERTLATEWTSVGERNAVLGDNAARVYRLPSPEVNE